MRRRQFLATAAAAALAAPAITRAASASTLRFIPQADLTILDPVWTTAYVTRNHGFMVFDTLYGQDGGYNASPQMVAGHVIENDGKLWTLSLRDGLQFHDGQKVLARDCVASVTRWGKRDAFGQALMAYTDEISAPDDRTIRFRLKKPFPLLANALAKSPSSMCPMMPERLALTDPFKQITEMVGSGPFKFIASERVPGARVVYEKFAGYQPRPDGTPDWTAGPKIVHFDRVEWSVIPDTATASAALQNNEQDWWEYASADLMPVLTAGGNVKVSVQDPSGSMAILRFNHTQAPFDNPAIRRALLGAVNQADVMTAVASSDQTLWHVPVGFFCPGSPSDSTVGMEALTSPRDPAKVKAALAEAGYKGEKVVLLAATDFPVLKAMADVMADALTRSGVSVDYQAMDWGSVVQRRAKHEGWNAFCTAWAGIDMLNPAVHQSLRGNGDAAIIGWPRAPRIEQLRDQWFDAPTPAAQADLAHQIQAQAFVDVPYLPLGQYKQATAYSTGLTGLLNGFALFWNVKRA
jgi:peptide/nickel transport system substrate-binding protein